jgi:hypothetical protein
MSDLASPLLVTMGDEAHAYICFCALMKRLHSNFLLDGIVMTLKFQHLAEGLLYYDPEFYAYLKSHQVSSYIQNMNSIYDLDAVMFVAVCSFRQLLHKYGLDEFTGRGYRCLYDSF